jgi:hypothetical protein
VTAIAARFAGGAADDVYITYRYADNLASGRGLVFNPGERVFGISDPGVAVLLAALHRATGVAIPVLGTAVTAAALLLIAGVLLAAGREAGREAEGWLGGSLLLGSFYVWMGQGSGPLPALACLLLAARLAGAGPLGAGLLAGLAFCCRPDAALGAAVLLLLLVLEARDRPPPGGGSGTRWRRPLRYGASFAAVAALALAAAWLYFGTPLPGTLEAKRAFAALAPRDLTGLAFWQPAVHWFVVLAGWGGPAFLLLGLLGQAPLFRGAGRPGRLLVLHALALAVFYTVARVPFFIWYTIPTAIAAVYGAAFLTGEAARRALAAGTGQAMAARRARRAVMSLAAALGVALALGAIAADIRWWRTARPDWRLFAYRRAGEWIRAHTPSGSDIAFDEVGILGYYSDRPILDLVGLVSPGSRPYAAVGDTLGAFLAKPADLLVLHTYDRRGGTRPILNRPWFGAAYEQIATIKDPDSPADIRIYRRRPGRPVPPARPPSPREHG